MSAGKLTILVVLAVLVNAVPSYSQNRPGLAEDTYITTRGQAAGTDDSAKDQAVADALRKAVEQACGVFIRSQSKAQDYTAIYDKVLANTAGYVLDYKILDSKVDGDITTVRVKAHVSTVKFEENWARIAHTVHQEGNPRVIIAIGEVTEELANKLAEETKSSSEKTSAAQYKSDSSSASSYDSLVQRYGSANVWTDERGRFWYWRSGRAYISTGEEVSASERAAAESHFRSSGASKSTQKDESQKLVWEAVARSVEEKGVVQGKIEDYFIDKGIKLMDRQTTDKVNKRDLALAMANDDLNQLKALGAKFHADVFILGTATAKYSREIEIGSAKMYQYSAKLVVRVVRADSGELLASKVFGPFTFNSSLRSGGEEKALGKLGDEYAPKLLAAVAEAWRKQVNVTRTVELTILGMDRRTWKKFEAEAGRIKGMQELRLREITESMATVDVEYQFNINSLADRLEELKDVKLEIIEQNPNRLKIRVVK